MKKQKNKKIIYYKDELNDDFAGTNINTKKIDSSFKFIHKNIFWRACSFLLYYLIVIPFIWIFMRVFLRVKYKNKKAIKKIKPCFIYGNHTSFIDAYIPNLLSFPRRNRIIVNPDTVSIKGLKNLTQMLGALPIPSTITAKKKFLQAVNYYSQKQNITIYPEAHIWPYFTKVRPFKDTSFYYPVKKNAPVIAFFTAYTKPKGLFSFMRKANITIHISDPIYPDNTLPIKQAQKDLRDKVYNFMLEKSKNSNYEVIEYKKI